MNIFDFDDYKEFVKKKIDSMPKKGYGQFRKIALALNMSTVAISLVFKGERNLTEEQGLDLTEYLALTPKESQFFLLMLRKARAGSYKLAQYYQKELEGYQLQMQQLQHRLPQNIHLSESVKNRYYSDCLYAAFRIAVGIKDLQTLDALAKYFKLSIAKASDICDFLSENGFVIMQAGRILPTTQRFHLEATSHHIRWRQIQWRLKGFNKMELADNSNLFFTAPMCISSADAKRIKRELTQFIEDLSKSVGKSKPSVLYCLNIDWFGI